MSTEAPTTENAGTEETPEVTENPTMINVRTEGLKVDLVLLENKVTGLSIDYQGIKGSEELHRWLRLIDGMLTDTSSSAQRSIPHILGDAVVERRTRPRLGAD